MHPTVNHMIQLQDLLQVRDEQNAAGVHEHLDRLEDSIDTLTRDLPEPYRTQFVKLSQRDRNVIVPIVDNSCTACRMQLPISHVQQVRMGREVLACSSCARYHYAPTSSARNISRGPKRFEVQKPGIARFSSKELMVARLGAKNKEGIITELAERMEAAKFVDNAAALIEQAMAREMLLSTAVDHGLAFPHVRGVEGGGLKVAAGLHPKGVHFDGPKGRLSHIFFFVVIPTAASSFYLKLLAGLTETFMVKQARDELLACETDEEMWKVLNKLTRKTIK